MRYIHFLIICLALNSCASYTPIFAPNYKFKSVGEDKANEDAKKCMEEADAYLKKSKQRRAVKETARGAGIGAFFGAVWSLFTGNSQQIVKSAAVGAGVGAVTKGGSVLAEDKLYQYPFLFIVLQLE